MLSVRYLVEFRIRPKEEVAKGLAPPEGKPATALVLLAVMQHVAALAESL